jgi:hypothetical protein
MLTLTTLNILSGLVHLSFWIKPLIILGKINMLSTDLIANSADHD